MPPEEQPTGGREESLSEGTTASLTEQLDQMCLVRNSLPLVVREGDSLRGHLEVNHRGGRWRVGAQGHAGGFLHRLDARQRLHLHGAQVPHITGCRNTWAGSDHTGPPRAERIQ